MEHTNPAILVLAAGQGTRMKSDQPKVLHDLMGRPLVEHVLGAALYLEPSRVVVVTGFGADLVEAQVSSFIAGINKKKEGQAKAKLIFVHQAQQLGTGHAVAMTKDALADFKGPMLIMAGDVPLISPNTLDGFLKAHHSLEADISVLTVRLENPGAYGRIIRGKNGWLKRIVEARDANDYERSQKEINSGFYLVKPSLLFESINQLQPNNDQGEYYLTDVVLNFRERGLKAAAIELPESASFEVMGINDRYELAAAQAIIKDRINESWLRAGVTMLDPLSTFIEVAVRLAPDVRLWPGVILTGHTTVGPGAEIGPFCHLNNCRVAAGAKVDGHQTYTQQDLGF